MSSDALWGRVIRVVYNKDAFYVLNVSVVGSDPSIAKSVETVRGSLYGLLQVKSGVPILFSGSWKRHEKYGRQFAARTWTPWAENSADVATFLSNCVGGFARDSVVSAFSALGPDVFARLSSDPGSFQKNPPEGLTEEDVDEALLGWGRMVSTRDLSVLLGTRGLTGQDIQVIASRFGMEAPAVILENPYRIMEIRGFSFPKVDALAEGLGLPADDPRRVAGVLLWQLQDKALEEGHLYLGRGELVQDLDDLLFSKGLRRLTGPADSIKNALQGMVERGSAVLEPDVGVYLPDYHDFEKKSASILAGLVQYSSDDAKTIDTQILDFMSDYERANGIVLSDAQRSAVEGLKQHRVLVLTGLPGTGKTLTVRALVRLFAESGLSFSLMAPTGIAAKRLSFVTGQPAATIHRALRYDGSEWGYGEHNRYVVDAVIVDEVSMVDQELLYRLLVSLRPGTMLVLVGDDAQLPSVGPGNVLRELAACENIPSVRLTQIFRQSEEGGIVLNSHRINRGEMPVLMDPRTDTEFKFVRMSDEERIVDAIVLMASKLKAKNANFQVLSPKYDGVTGVNNLNDRLRDVLNPVGSKEWHQGTSRFRLGDRLMVVRNDYKLGVYNGDVGKLVRIGDDSLTVKIHAVGEHVPDMEVEFPQHKAGDFLRLAYAITIHKSQGNEFDTIVMPLVKRHGRMLQRNLLYTAVTRARSSVWILGEESAIRKAVDNNRVIRRNTSLGRSVSRFVLEGVPPLEAIEE